MENLIQEIYNLKTHKDIITNNIERLKADLLVLDASLEVKEAELLQRLADKDILEYETGELVGFKQSKKNVGYTSESAVIELLKSQFAGQYVKCKMTESIDKNALKKALKTDEALNESLEPYIINSSTDYVVVTTKANRERMLEHINESKK